MLGRNKITQVLDPSHKAWVQGGIFQDLRKASNVFCKKPIYLGSPFKTQHLLTWIKANFNILLSKNLLFSSLTPLENYYRIFRFFPKFHKRVLWFTHNEEPFNKTQFLAIDNCDCLLVHSKRAKQTLSEIFEVKINIILAAVQFENFKNLSSRGQRIVWIGTYSRRKRPEIFLNLVRSNPHLEFRILGKNWGGSFVDGLLLELGNLEYFELDGVLKSEHFKGCDIYLCTSEIEGAPMPLLESIAAGLNPISTDVGFVRDIFEYFQISEKFIYTSEDEVIELVNSLRLNSSQRIDHNRTLIKNLSFENLGKLIQSSFDI